MCCRSPPAHPAKSSLRTLSWPKCETTSLASEVQLRTTLLKKRVRPSFRRSLDGQTGADSLRNRRHLESSRESKSVATRPGLEPEITEPKSAVLPITPPGSCADGKTIRHTENCKGNLRAPGRAVLFHLAIWNRRNTHFRRESRDFKPTLENLVEICAHRKVGESRGD